MDQQPTSDIRRSGCVGQAGTVAEAEAAHVSASGTADERHHTEPSRDVVSAQEPLGREVHGAQPETDVWDPETWSGPAQASLTVFALVTPFVMWFIAVDHLPEAWVDWAAIPILGLGDLFASMAFVFVYGSVRTLLRPSSERSAAGRQAGRHRR